MIWLHWLMLVAVIYGSVQLFLIAMSDDERFEDVDALAKASRSDGEMTGTGTDSSLRAARPGPIRGPLTNGRR